MSFVQNKVLIAALLLVAMVVMFEVASAQYGGRGYGGYGGYGGGRGHHGGRGYHGGGGRGYGGYGGYGGGYGRGGYGGYGGYGGRGYRGTSDYGYGYDSTYPSTSYGGDGGYYDGSSLGLGEDEFSSFMDVYATSSSSPSTSSSGGGTTSVAAASSPASTARQPPPSPQSTATNLGDRNFQADGQLGGNNAAAADSWPIDQFGPQGAWPFLGPQNGVQSTTRNGVNQQWSPSLVGSNGGQFESTSSSTGSPGERWSLGESSGAAGSGSLSRAPTAVGVTDKTRERNILAPVSSALASKPAAVAPPVVPSSTTTPAPEYVMINPSRASGGSGSESSSDQDE